MPHIIIKMYPGRTAEQKEKMAAAITESVTSIVNCEAKSVSIAIEEVKPEEWAEKVYKPEILEKENTLVKKPGYNPFSR
jgi:4-oxalocrotonate tautomerase